MKKLLFLGLMLVSAVLVFGTSKAFADDFTVGNDTSVRDNTDSYTNFTIIDTNHPAEFTGDLTTFSYYASKTNHFRFVVVDEDDVVKWVGGEITPPSVGVHTYTPGTPVHVEEGWNVGMYFVTEGAIPFDLGGEPAVWTPNNNGLPHVGDTLSLEAPIEGWTDRIYSFVANGHTDESNDNDNNGNEEGNGVEREGDGTYKNHGQYVKSQEDKREAAHSRIGMPVQSKGHTK